MFKAKEKQIKELDRTDKVYKKRHELVCIIIGPNRHVTKMYIYYINNCYPILYPLHQEDRGVTPMMI